MFGSTSVFFVFQQLTKTLLFKLVPPPVEPLRLVLVPSYVIFVFSILSISLRVFKYVFCFLFCFLFVSHSGCSIVARAALARAVCALVSIVVAMIVAVAMTVVAMVVVAMIVVCGGGPPG